MATNRWKYWTLGLWVFFLLFVASIIGSITRPEIIGWYSQLQRSSLTPPDAVFPIAWIILYVLIAISGWLLWQARTISGLTQIKTLYIIQLLLNWSWSPLFFAYHSVGLALLVLITLNIVVAILIYKAFAKIKTVAFLLCPYIFWSLFAAYLNFYIWWFN